MFAVIENKNEFINKLNNGEIDQSWIVFIKDTHEIWAQNTYFGVNNHKVVSSEEYSQLSIDGLIDDNTFYYISE